MKPLLLACLLALAPVCGCGRAGNAAQPAEVASNSNSEYVAESEGVRLMTVKETAVPQYLELPGQIEADPTRVVHVYPPVGGRIVELRVRPWDHVEKGQTLAILESADLSRAVADYHKALADSRVKQQGLARSQDLLAHHAIAEKDYQQAQADAQSALADLSAARDQIRVFGVDPDEASSQFQVVAPRSGVILDVGAAPGEFSKALAAPAPLCTVADIGTIWTVGDIYEKDLAAVRAGEPAQVTLAAYPGRVWTGRVGVVSDAVDPSTRTLRVRVVLANPSEQIKPAMFASIRILRASPAGILVPATAVLREGTAASVFVSKSDHRFERRSVTLGPAQGDMVEIAAGIRPGEVIVSEGALLLREAAGN